MEIVPYFIHPEVLKVTELYNLDLFNMDNYVFDDIHENHEYLQSLDPRDWKDQDHYAVLRLRKVRNNASQELIKQAYRKQLLDHHPDKGKQRLRKCDDENNDYFTCITKAFDLLKDPVSRNSYDSVDPEFDDSIPTLREAKETFYKSFGPVFQRNTRWSKAQPVPLLGDDNTDIDEVHRFYNFWDDFRSWREFSYLDEESKDQADSRDERRYIDKLNKSERKKKSQEECKRINNLVEMAKANDPRIIRFNAQRKAEKEAEKQAKMNRKLEIKMAAEKVLREEKEKLEREEAERQQRLKDEAGNLKKQKEAVKIRQKAEKRRLRKVAETFNYFGEVLSQCSSRSVEICRAEMMNTIDALCLKMPLDDMGALNDELDRCGAAEDALLAAIRAAADRLAGGGRPQQQTAQKQTDTAAAGNSAVQRCGTREWTFQLSQFLIKAINCNPPGTKHRWHTIAEYMNAHHPGLAVTERQVIQRAKLLKTDDSVMKKEAAVHNLVTKADIAVVDNNNTDKADVGHKGDSAAVRIATDEKTVVRSAWSIDEQRQLEIALKSVPASDPARWDRISEFVATRSKKECMLRFKECAEKMKAKKAAQ